MDYKDPHLVPLSDIPIKTVELQQYLSMDSVLRERINMSSMRLVSDEERKAQALARIQAYETRPSTVAAEAFFGGNDAQKTLHWETLPQRVHELCRALEQWVRRNRFLFDTLCR